MMRTRNDRRPNILIVCLDALRRDFVPAYEDSEEDIELISRAERSGIVFDNAIASANWTVPSHASLFTGLEPQQHRVFNWRQRIPEPVETIFSRLHSTGYRLAYLTSEGVRKLVDNRQDLFTIFDDTNSAKRADIRRELDRPWCLFWHFLDTHAPYNIKAERPPRMELVDWQVSDPTINYLREMVCGSRVEEIRQKVRANFRRAAQAIDEVLRRLGSNTIFVFLSDHGEDWRPHHPFHCSFEAPVLRIPLLVSAQGLPASRDSQLVSHADVLELVWRLASTDSRDRVKVYSRWSSMSHQRARVVVCGPNAFDNQEVFFAVVTGERLLLEKPSTGQREYFNLCGRHRKEIRPARSDALFPRLERSLQEVLQEFRAPMAIEPEITDEDTDALLQRLQKLGYI